MSEPLKDEDPMKTNERRRVLEVRYHRDPPFAAACDLIGPNGWTDEDGCNHNGPTLGTALKVASLFDAIGYDARIDAGAVIIHNNRLRAILVESEERAERAEAELARYRAVVDAAKSIGDSNFRRLENLLREHSWAVAADRVQGFRKALEDIFQAERKNR
jgi:hypothetical protein